MFSVQGVVLYGEGRHGEGRSPKQWQDPRLVYSVCVCARACASGCVCLCACVRACVRAFVRSGVRACVRSFVCVHMCKQLCLHLFRRLPNYRLYYSIDISIINIFVYFKAKLVSMFCEGLVFI